MLKFCGTFKDFSDGSLKSVFENSDGGIIEMSLLLNRKDTDVVCVPTHHFCSLGCKMCHLTNKCLEKKMTRLQIDEFMEALFKAITNKSGKRTDNKKLLVSFMGVGEPLLNQELIFDVFSRSEEIKAYGYQEVCFSLATMVPNLALLYKLISSVESLSMPLKIHFSMHSPLDENRKNLLPSTTAKNEEILERLRSFSENIAKNRNFVEIYSKFHQKIDPTEIHYTLIKDVNDSRVELEKLCEYLERFKIPIKFITLNPTKDYQKSDKTMSWVNAIKERVKGQKIKVYTPPGREIGSSCGEFTKHYYHQEIETKAEFEEFLEWKEKHQIFD